MVFQPSNLSLPPGAEYDGWFTNLFTREGRAENKENRAARKLERAQKAEKSGRSRAASRLRRKSDKLNVRSSDLLEKAGKTKQIQGLTNEKNFEKLWQDPFPWRQRPARKGTKWSGGARRMKYMAEGYRPDEKYINSEYRAVIAGGLTMLASAFNPETGAPGYPPFDTSVNIDALPGLLRAKGQKHDAELLKIVKACWQNDPVRERYSKAKKPPSNLKTAAEYITSAVTERYLAKPAWAMRAMYMIGMANERSQRTGMAAKITAATVATIGAAVATAFTFGGAGPLAGPGVASMWAIIGAGAAVGGAVVGGAASAKSAIQKARLEPQHEIYRSTSMAALEERNVEVQSQQVDYEKLATQELTRELEEVLRQRAEARNLILKYAAYGSIAIIGVAGLVRVVK